MSGYDIAANANLRIHDAQYTDEEYECCIGWGHSTYRHAFRDTCELYKSIDVRRWRREGRLRAGQQFSWSWTSGGEPSGTVNVRTEVDAVVLIYRVRSFLAEWKSTEQRVSITWTHCHFGGAALGVPARPHERKILRAAGGRAVPRRKIVAYLLLRAQAEEAEALTLGPCQAKPP